jgi:exodeoxyribonuclease V alpha subunit
MSSTKRGDKMVEINGTAGIIKRVFFQKDDFVVAQFKPDNIMAIEQPVITGALFDIQKDDRLKIWGEWVEHPSYGKQIKVVKWEKLLPTTKEQVVDYLSSNFIKGVGKVKAQAIVEVLGDNAIDHILKNGPEVLSSIKGIGEKQADTIYESIIENFEVQQTIINLQSLGLATNIAIKAYKEWGSSAYSKILKNPYCLTDLSLIAFQKADQIARQMGIQPDSPFRIQAGIKHLLKEEAALWGHCYLPEDKLIEKAMGQLNNNETSITPYQLQSTLHEMHINGEIVISGQAIYLSYFYDLEILLAKKAKVLLEYKPKITKGADIEAFINTFQQDAKINLSELQKESIRQIANKQLVILTGGPGTGKTQTTKAIIEYMIKTGRKVLLTAPTGRAARRLADVTGQEACTIHRILNITPQTNEPEYNEYNPLDCDFLVIDEFSMAGLKISKMLFDAISPATKVLIVGDSDQLPSVEPGSVLHDLIKAGAPLVKLTEVFRQAKESQIVTSAHSINNGAFPIFNHAKGDFYFIEQESPGIIANTIVKSVLRFKELGYSNDDIQVLSPMRKTDCGIDALNIMLQSTLNPETEKIEFGQRVFKLGDKVMQTKNNYDKNVFNGDIGFIERINPNECKITVKYTDTCVEYDKEGVSELTLAYAITVHKSQGSEYPIIIMPLTTSHYIMLARNLIYTGITRAKQKVVLIGTKKALSIAINNNKTTVRYTMLTERIKNTILELKKQAGSTTLRLKSWA